MGSEDWLTVTAKPFNSQVSSTYSLLVFLVVGGDWCMVTLDGNVFSRDLASSHGSFIDRLFSSKSVLGMLRMWRAEYFIRLFVDSATRLVVMWGTLKQFNAIF